MLHAALRLRIEWPCPGAARPSADSDCTGPHIDRPLTLATDLRAMHCPNSLLLCAFPNGVHLVLLFQSTATSSSTGRVTISGLKPLCAPPAPFFALGISSTPLRSLIPSWCVRPLSFSKLFLTRTSALLIGGGIPSLQLLVPLRVHSAARLSQMPSLNCLSCPITCDPHVCG